MCNRDNERERKRLLSREAERVQTLYKHFEGERESEKQKASERLRGFILPGQRKRDVTK